MADITGTALGVVDLLIVLVLSYVIVFHVLLEEIDDV